MSGIQQLRKWIYGRYAERVGLEPNAHYILGSPIRPVVPLDVARGGLFVIGAYPSARFHNIDGVRDVPVGDNLGPFENERWFDGSRVRKQLSAVELQDHYLQPMGLARKECWITNLVKVFLFKEGHREKYNRLGASPPAGYRRESFRELGERSVPFLERELRLAKPRLVVTLGREVAGVLRGVRSPSAQTALLVPAVSDLRIGSMTFSTMHCAHPGILMRAGTDPQRQGAAPSWRERHEEEFRPALQRAWRC